MTKKGRAESTRGVAWWGPLAAALATVVAFANSVSNTLVWTDVVQIQRGSRLIDSWSTLAYAFATPSELNFYRPIQDLSNSVDAWIWRTQYSGFHLTNVLLHALTASLLCLIARELFERWRLPHAGWAAFFCASIWSIQPTKTESVAWISGRTDLLQCFGLAALAWGLVILRRVESRPAWRPKAWTWVAIPFLFTFSLLAKETAVLLPLFLALSHWSGRYRNIPGTVLRMLYVPTAVLWGLYVFLRLMFLWRPVQNEAPIDLGTRLLTQPVVWVDYLATLIWPVRATISDVVELHSRVDWQVASAVSLCVAAAVVVWRLAKREDGRGYLWAAGWIAIGLGPVSNFLPRPRDAVSPVPALAVVFPVAVRVRFFEM